MAQDLPTLRDERLTLRPLEEADLDELAEVIMSPGVSEWWGSPGDLDTKRNDLRTDGSAFCIEVEGQRAGWLGFEEENEPDYRHAGLDIMLAPPYQGRGLGPAALRLAARWLIDERGHHRLTIDPTAVNTRAIRAYEALGFRPVGLMRQYERAPDGTWRDNLLMDLLAEELD